jgi:hypothetical protein
MALLHVALLLNTLLQLGALKVAELLYNHWGQLTPMKFLKTFIR